MDAFRKKQNKQIEFDGIGGEPCPCCSWFHGKTKYLLNKQARRKLQEEDRRYIQEHINGMED